MGANSDFAPLQSDSFGLCADVIEYDCRCDTRRAFHCPKTAYKSHYLSARSLTRRHCRIFESTTDDEIPSFHRFHAARKLTQESAPAKLRTPILAACLPYPAPPAVAAGEAAPARAGWRNPPAHACLQRQAQTGRTGLTDSSRALGRGWDWSTN